MQKINEMYLNLKNKQLNNIKSLDLFKLTKTFIEESANEMNEVFYEIYSDSKVNINDEEMQEIMDIICAYHLDFLINMKIENNNISERIWKD